MRSALALILLVVACRDASAQSGADPYAMFIDVRAFCSAMTEANRQTLDLAENRLDDIKRDLAAFSALLARRDKVAADLVEARARVAAQRRDADELKTQLSHLSPTMIQERTLVSADLRAHLEVLDRFRQFERLFEIELEGLEAEVAAKRPQSDRLMRTAVPASDSDLRRCIADGRNRLK